MDVFTSLNSIDLHLFIILFAVATLAGGIDAIAGGGGLLTIPALLWAGLPPLQALATNKLQASFGSFTATYTYTRQGLINPSEHCLAIALTFIGAACGAWVVQQIDSSFLAKLIPLLMMGFALYFMFAPKLGDEERHQRIGKNMFAAMAGFGIGFYDGFFGPGTGTFFVIAFVTLLGYSLPRATGGTKLLNFTSNIASLILFSLSGHILWLLGLGMGLGQIIGSYLGSKLAIKHGSRLIRPLLVIVSLLVSLRLLLQT
ncbi:TSUP family transporter [uncultured Thiothrix sp.]|uniref:TSUP family transporter n=1 Tax=uncultured Thiothrix sp. TaxID=223185 RepID=UPI00261B24D9|nr:TSUP family transporter [uncultured Thiothrix sp.]